jgi:NADH:ubiquinone oxidoreductase subunit F (NADH-binding)
MTALLRAVPRDAGSAPILAQPVYHYGDGDPISELAPHDLAAHQQQYGRRPPCRAGDGVDLIEAIDEANLTGRGGAHLPSAIKWRAVRAAATHGRRPVIVANGAEGEPHSRKDATLLQLRPHLVLDGLACAAEALGADQAVIWLHQGAHALRSAVAAALAERTAHQNKPPIEIAVGPDAYLSGESGAVVRALSGGPALPAFRTVSSAVHGVHGAPTLVHNVETLVHVAQLARGTPPTSALVTVCVGDARVVLEAQTDELVQHVINRAAGAGVSAVLLGGYGGTWCSWPDLERLCLAEPEMRARRLSLGAGVLEVLRPGSCGLMRAAEIADYLAMQSAGQCGPCVFGVRSVADALAAAVRGGRRGRHCLIDLATYTAEIRGRGACHLPDGAVRMVTSALEVFADDLDAHRSGRCLAKGVSA